MRQEFIPEKPVAVKIEEKFTLQSQSGVTSILSRITNEKLVRKARLEEVISDFPRKTAAGAGAGKGSCFAGF